MPARIAGTIVADENIPCVEEFFGDFGDVRLVPGRRIDAEVVRDAVVLLVRSVTRVDASLLEGSSIAFVGTATIGTDHVDVGYLRGRGIAFASAPGSNANSVAEYVVAALLSLSRMKEFRLEGRCVGVVGVGNVGSRVARYLEILGMEVLLNDPPRKLRERGFPDVPLEEIMECDVVTLHVPLEKNGDFPTFHMMNSETLSRLKEGAVFVNTSRGAVVDTAALKERLAEGGVSAVVDVWENEPVIDLELLSLVDVATPHIAGYSLDGKIKATWMLYESFCRFVGEEPQLQLKRFLPPPPLPSVVVEGGGREVEAVVADAVLRVYDPLRDDAALRKLGEMGEEERGGYFDSLRKNYPVRREFFNTEVVLTGGCSAAASVLRGLGFTVKEDR